MPVVAALPLSSVPPTEDDAYLREYVRELAPLLFGAALFAATRGRGAGLSSSRRGTSIWSELKRGASGAEIPIEDVRALREIVRRYETWHPKEADELAQQALERYLFYRQRHPEVSSPEARSVILGGVRRDLMRYAQNLERTVPGSQEGFEFERSVRRLQQLLGHRFGEPPSPERIARYAKRMYGKTWSPEDIGQVLAGQAVPRPPVPLPAPPTTTPSPEMETLFRALAGPGGRKGTTARRLDEARLSVPPEAESRIEEITRSQQLSAVQQALSRLPEKERTVLLGLAEGRSGADIARSLGVSRMAVSYTKRRALARLEEELRRLGVEGRTPPGSSAVRRGTGELSP